MPTQASSLFTQSLVTASQRGVGMCGALAQDIPANRFARLLVNNGTPIVANHPAYAIGHLALYPAKIASFLGIDPAPYTCPESWAGLFEQKLDCLDDPDGSIYPGKDEIVRAFNSGYEKILEAVASVDESVFAHENPIERIRDRFPTVGVMVTFMLTSHVMFHLGQVSTWRRCEGHGSVM